MHKEMTLGERLAALRHEKKWTQKDLAEKLSVSDKAVSKWETDENEISFSELQKVSQLFDVTLDFLVKGEVINDKDKEAVRRLEYMEKEEAAKKKAEEFLKDTKYKGKAAELFVFHEGEAYLKLAEVLQLDDFQLFEKANESFDFVIPVTANKPLTFEALISRGCQEKKNYLLHRYSNQPEYEVKQRPVCLSFKEVEGLSLEFLEYKGTSVDVCAALETMKFASFKGIRAYETIVWLIDHGAHFKRVAPSGSAYCSVEEDTFKTGFVYKVCTDQIQTEKRLAALEGK